MELINLKFSAPFKIDKQKREGLSNFKKTGFRFFSTISKKEVKNLTNQRVMLRLFKNPGFDFWC